METMMIIIEPVSSHSKEMASDGHSGEMDIMGYQTQNFHVCPGAQESFSMMVKQGHRDEDADALVNLAMLVDEYLGMKSSAAESGPSPELIKGMVDKGNSAMFHLGSFANKLGDESMIQLFDFMPGHILQAMGHDDEPISMEGLNDESLSIEMGGGSC
tara:strand:- start:933 stop:1406 length:474 start_codon:yes stop_codon:yes gene_type:complete